MDIVINYLIATTTTQNGTVKFLRKDVKYRYYVRFLSKAKLFTTIHEAKREMLKGDFILHVEIAKKYGIIRLK